MPNHITNHIEAEPEVIQKIRNLMEDEKGEFDFNKVIPTPCNIYQGNLGKAEEEKYGKENCWYEWNIKHWGTKWNAYGYRKGDGGYKDYRNDDRNIYFDTAWAMPMPVCEALAKALSDCQFVWEYADDDVGHNCGRLIITKGDVYESDIGVSCKVCWARSLKGYE